MFKPVMAALLSALLITGCTPHPGAGVWLAPGANADDITKVEVHFDPKVNIYSSASKEPALQCGWWATDKQNIEMECVYLSDTDKKVKYQLNVTAEDVAELIREKILITRLIRQRD